MTSWFIMYKGAIQLKHMCASPISQWITYSVHLFSKQSKAGESVKKNLLIFLTTLV